MYTKADNSYYPPQPNKPPVATGFPASSQFYPQSTDNSAFQVESQPLAPWSTGLCDCGEDVCNCCITCWCPCITFGQIAEIVDKGSTSCGASGALYTLILCLTGCQCIYSCFYRSKMRGQYSLHESPCNDCLIHCFCESCALCQEYRELKKRGFDMNIGWQSNMERQGLAAPTTVPPIVEGGMRR